MDHCYVFRSHACGLLDELVGMTEAADYNHMSREAGLRLLANIWGNFHHIGEVPTEAEIQQAAGANICATCS